jgi:hypothetical protein
LRSTCLAALLLFAACTKDSASEPIAWDGLPGKPATFPTTWAQVADPPATYATTWDQVAGKPVSFPADWADVAGKPVSYPTTWAEIADAPFSFPSSWSQVSDKPATFPGTWAEVSGKPTSFPTTWANVTGTPASFPSAWADVAGKPSTFPVDPASVQLRVTGTCSAGSAVTQVNQDGTVACGSRPATVPLPPTTWAPFQCASVSNVYGLGGLSVPSLRFQPAGGACGLLSTAQTSLTIPYELPSGPRPFRVRAIVSQSLSTGAGSLYLSWRVATAAAGAAAFGCNGARSVTVPALPDVQAMTTVEFDFRTDPALCGAAGDPLVLSLSRGSDAGTNDLVVRNVHVVFD